MKRFILAHDLGTTGNKATLFDQEGQNRGSSFFSYSTEYAQTGWAEQDPQDWWSAVCQSTRRLLAKAAVPPVEVACLVFSGQMMGCAPLDEHARPLRKALIWADQRSVEQVRRLSEKVLPERVYRLTGHRLSASYSLAKMLWLRDNEPQVYRQAYKLMHAKDAVIARLTGVFATEPSDASGMNLFDLEGGDWAGEIVAAAGIDPGKLPEVVPSTRVVGGVRREVAEEIGLPAGTPVVIGGGDGVCAAVGAGVVQEGMAFNYIGSSSWIALASQRPIYDPDQKTFTFAHLVPGMFCPCGTMQAAGGAYQWTRQQLGAPEVQAALDLDVSAYELLNLQAEKSPPGAGGLIFLPYLLGERSPWWNPRARGAFIGLTMLHRRQDMIRAVLEGVTMNLRLILEAFLNQGARIAAMRVIGGGARSRLWNQLLADVYGLPVQRLALLEEATSMGAAVAGGVGVGLYQDFSMIENMNQVVSTCQPDPLAQATYNRLFPVFVAAYRALEPVFDRLAELNLA
jgi:xylulokinase